MLDPYPWMFVGSGRRYSEPSPLVGFHAYEFRPRPGYSQNREDYAC